MIRRSISIAVAAATLVSAGASFAAEDAPSVEELWEMVQAQQAQLEALQDELNASRAQSSTVQIQMLENSERIEAVGEVIDTSPSLGAASWADRTSIGGYGEMLYNNETSNPDSKELDIQRFVLYVGHEFNEDLRFYSEVEIEHSFIADDARAPGAVELEQAYIEWDYTTDHSVLAGMHLAPLGLMNETHEPNTFYGVERNRTESRIIPTTYRVNGVKFAGLLGGGFSYDMGLHEGLFFESGNGGELTIRDSRQSGARAEMESPAYTGRVRYTGMAGLELGLSLQYQTDMTQDGRTRSNINRRGLEDEFGNPVTGLDGILTEAHVDYRSGAWGFRALYAQWDINDKIASVANSAGDNNGLGRNEQYGYYLEPSLRISDNFGLFARYERTDERAGSDVGDAKDSMTNRSLLGMNYWLHENVVFKFDYQFVNDETSRDLDGFNLGVGWQF